VSVQGSSQTKIITSETQDWSRPWIVQSSSRQLEALPVGPAGQVAPFAEEPQFTVQCPSQHCWDAPQRVLSLHGANSGTSGHGPQSAAQLPQVSPFEQVPSPQRGGAQVTPSPTKPVLQAQLKEPGWFVQTAWLEQLSTPIAHSSMSAQAEPASA
jgi:hypothetical protein